MEVLAVCEHRARQCDWRWCQQLRRRCRAWGDRVFEGSAYPGTMDEQLQWRLGDVGELEQWTNADGCSSRAGAIGTDRDEPADATVAWRERYSHIGSRRCEHHCDALFWHAQHPQALHARDAEYHRRLTRNKLHP